MKKKSTLISCLRLNCTPVIVMVILLVSAHSQSNAETVKLSDSNVLQTASTATSSSNNGSIVWHYLALPSTEYAIAITGERFAGGFALEKFRRSIISIEDIKNGYLKLEGANEGWSELALFKRKDASPLIAIADIDCAPACQGKLKFLTIDHSATASSWLNTTATVFPNIHRAYIQQLMQAKKLNLQNADINYYFKLPRQGTTISLMCSLCNKDATGDALLQSFIWDGSTFAAKP